MNLVLWLSHAGRSKDYLMKIFIASVYLLVLRNGVDLKILCLMRGL